MTDYQQLSRISLAIAALCALLFCSAVTADELPSYKLCVPHQIFDACQQLMTKASQVATIECISARDRMECLQLVESRRADFVAVDPEDMYVALNMRNEDFAVFSEIRTKEEAQSAFRYLGIILLRKSSAIRSLRDLQGHKSCHTGFGRNVGYKIPITKLKNAGVLRIEDDPRLSYVEKELKGLTQLFGKSCLVGEYSPNVELNAALKKRYSSLCALCEDPVKCDYPDKYSGYEGAIKCLVENGGDVAFTKVIYVNRYFGLPVGNNPATTTAQANPDDYEYLCADGSRQPITGTPCTWAQRPWQAYMGNADVKTRVGPLQQQIETVYTAGQEQAATGGAQAAANAAKLWIDEKHVVVAKDQHSLPGDHLEAAQYRDVIERDGNYQLKIRLCVRTALELRKCELLARVAFARDIRPNFECLQLPDCVRAVKNSDADAAVVPATQFGRARKLGLTPIVYEKLDEKDAYVAVAPRALAALDERTPIFFDELNPRSVDVALLLQHNGQCPDTLHSANVAGEAVRVMRSSQLPEVEAPAEHQLICADGERKPLSDWAECNFNGRLHPNAIFTGSNLPPVSSEAISHGFVALSDKFGHGMKTEEVFELFGEFEEGKRNVLFGDDTARFEAIGNELDRIQEENTYQKLHCMSD